MTAAERMRPLTGPEQEVLRWRLGVVGRAYELRRIGRLPVIWIDEWSVYVARAGSDWDTKVRIGWDELERLVVAAELETVPRRTAVSEVGSRNPADEGDGGARLGVASRFERVG